MSGGLFPTLPPSPWETPGSFTSRLAALHRTSGGDFCRDLGLDYMAIARGCTDAIGELAAVAGVAADHLLENRIRKIDANAWELRGERLARQTMRRSRIMVCLHCLAADIEGSDLWPACAAYGRVTWQLDPIRSCRLHATRLVEVARVVEPRRIGDFAANVAPTLCNLQSLISASRACPPSDLEEYLLARLEGRRGASPWLDGLDWHAAADVCQMIGVAAIYDRDQALRALDDELWRTAGDAGFAIARDGIDGIGELLMAMERDYERSRSSTEGPQAIFGQLHRWLAACCGRSELEPIRDVIRNHVQRHHPVGPGDSIFGKPFERRLLHSIRSASLEYGIHPKRLRKTLIAKGVLDGTSANLTDERSTFGANVHHDLIVNAADSLSLTEVETYLGCGRVHARMLYQKGFIEPLVIFSEGELNFARAHLDAFMHRLLASAFETKEVSGVYDIPKAAKRANCSASEILNAILDGRLKHVGFCGDRKHYSSIRVDLSELKRLVHGERLPGVTAREAEKLLGTTTKVVAALIQGGHLETVKTVNPVNRCPLLLIPHAAIEAFQEKYVSSFHLAKMRGLHITRLRMELSDRGIVPSLTSDVYGTSFYLKADLN